MSIEVAEDALVFQFLLFNFRSQGFDFLLLFYIKCGRFQCRFYVCDETDSRFHGTSLPAMPRHSAYQHQRVYQSMYYYFLKIKRHDGNGLYSVAVVKIEWAASRCKQTSTILRLVFIGGSL